MNVSYLVFDSKLVEVPEQLLDDLISSLSEKYYLETLVSPDDNIISTDFLLRSSALDKPIWFARSGIDI